MVNLQLEHALGYAGQYPNMLKKLSNNQYVSAFGSSMVLATMNDPNSQIFFKAHTDKICCLAISPDETKCATGQIGTNSDIYLWDIKNCQMLMKFEEHDFGIIDVCFSHDSRLLLTLGRDNQLFIIDTVLGGIVGATKIQNACCIAWCGFDRDIKGLASDKLLFATCGDQIMLWLFDLLNGGLTAIPISSGAIRRKYTCLAFSSDSSRLYIGTESGDVVIVSVTGRRILSVSAAGSSAVRCLEAADATDGSYAAFFVGCDDGQVRLLSGDGTNFYEQASAILPHSVTSLSIILNDLSTGIAGTINGTLAEITLRANQGGNFPVRIFSENHSLPLGGISFVPQKTNQLVTLCQDHIIRMWNIDQYKILHSTKLSFADDVKAHCVAAGSIQLYTGHSDGVIRAYDVESAGQLFFEIPNAHVKGVTALTLSKNERFLISGGGDGSVRLWNLRSRQIICHLKEHTAAVTAIKLSPDNKTAFSSSVDGTMIVWDLTAERAINIYSVRQGELRDIIVSLDLTRVITACADGTITIFNLTDQSQVVLALPQGIEAHSLALTNDGMYFLVGCSDGMVRVLRYTNGELVAEGVPHAAPVVHIAVNKNKTTDTETVVSVDTDGVVFVYKLF
eukprot:TRINITY_DN2772_c0_g1_i2.p1 TRINITY_DN2772_c0_g1~~TRINITY_DN2772_c0_g1_i2.p1  ORF type:complete len:631 (+),score=141.12 TRINITY_DN2772_c0_g1_i2:32-1894(+)